MKKIDQNFLRNTKTDEANSVRPRSLKTITANFICPPKNGGAILEKGLIFKPAFSQAGK
jgi:hypothetical protein